MGKAIPCDIGGIHFPRKQDAHDYAKATLASYEGCLLPMTLRLEHLDFVSDLLTRHPNFEDKVGPGVAEWVVMREPEYNSRCFGILRTDDQYVDFSYRKCIDGESLWADLCRRFRALIADDVRAFKQAAMDGHGLRCALTGQSLAWEDAHVDHERPLFVELVRAFLAEKKLDVAKLRWEGRGADTSGARLKDSHLEAEWVAYHRAYATLRILYAPLNQGRPKKTEAAEE